MPKAGNKSQVKSLIVLLKLINLANKNKSPNDIMHELDIQLKTPNLPYSKSDRQLNEFGRWTDTGSKSLLREEWERLAGTSDDTLTNDELIQIINNKNDAAFKAAFQKVLDEIEECLFMEALERIVINHPEFSKYPPFHEAIRLKQQEFEKLI